MSYIKGFKEFRQMNKMENTELSLQEFCALLEGIQNDTRLNEENIFKGIGDRIKTFFGNFRNIFSENQRNLLKKILPKKKFSLTSDQSKWVYDYVVKTEGEFTVNNFLKCFKKLLDKGGKNQIKEVVSLPGEVATVASKLPGKVAVSMPELPPVPKIPNLITALTPESGDVADVAKDVGDLGMKHPEYILFAAVLGLLLFGGFKLIEFLKNKNKKIELKDLQAKVPNPPDEKPEMPNVRTPNPPDEKPEMPSVRTPNPPDEKLEQPKSQQENLKDFQLAIQNMRYGEKSLGSYNAKGTPGPGWYYRTDTDMLENGNYGYETYPPTKKPDGISTERWIQILQDFSDGKKGADSPKELEKLGYRLMTNTEFEKMKKEESEYQALLNGNMLGDGKELAKSPGMHPIGKDFSKDLGVEDYVNKLTPKVDAPSVKIPNQPDKNP